MGKRGKGEEWETEKEKREGENRANRQDKEERRKGWITQKRKEGGRKIISDRSRFFG